MRLLPAIHVRGNIESDDKSSQAIPYELSINFSSSGIYTACSQKDWDKLIRID